MIGLIMSSVKYRALCLVIVGWSYSADLEVKSASKVCRDVATEAQRQNVPVDEALALTWAESRFSYEPNKITGAQGPMQVLPKWWCKKKGKCNYVRAGVTALKTFKKLFPPFKNAICHYNSGVQEDCPSRSVRFAEAVEGYRVKIKREIYKQNRVEKKKEQKQ